MPTVPPEAATATEGTPPPPSSSDRRRAEEYVDKEEPLVLIGSPPCVAFSQLQSLVEDESFGDEFRAAGASAPK